MKKGVLLIGILILSAFVLIAGCSPKGKPAPQAEAAAPAVEEKPIVVGFVYVGPVGDGGWTYAHDQGRKYLEEQFGTKVKTIIKESVKEGPEVKDIVRNMIDQGATIIFATSFGYMDYIEEISKEFPNVKFMHCSGYKTTANMGNYFGRIEEPRFLSGIVAGMKTKTNKIGYVAAYEIPEVIRGINAFTLGVQAVNPKAKVYVTWTHTWYDPAKEKEAAKALLDQKCDIITQHQDTAGPQQAAEEKGAFSIGYNSDMKNMAPKAYMTAPIWNWGPFYAAQVQSVIDGTWTPVSYWEGSSKDIVKLAPLTELAPEGAQAKVDEYSAKIIDGSFKVFTGPIKDQSGKVKVEAGSVLADSDQLSCNWFVQGVVGKIESQSK